jgi:hypothetical protein
MKKPALTLTLLLLLTAAHAADFPDMPPLKEGLWKIRMVNNTPGQPPSDNTFSLCRDHAFDAHTHQVAQRFLSACTTTSDTKSGNTRTLVQSCKIAGSTVITKSVLTADGDTHYRTESTSTFTPPLQGQSKDSMIQEQTFIGACPANMRPGDRKLADGTVTTHSR